MNFRLSGFIIVCFGVVVAIATIQDTTITTQLIKGESKKVTWELINWVENHDVIAASSAGCLVEIGNPKVVLRFFLQPFERSGRNSQYETVTKWYSLHAEVLRSRHNVAIKVTAKDGNYDGKYLSKDGTVMPTNSKGKIMTVIEEFIYLQTWKRDENGNRYGLTEGPLMTTWKQAGVKELKLSIEVILFDLYVPGVGTNIVVEADNKKGPTEAESSLISHLKSMYTTDNNFSDLKLETKDNMTLRVHKFLLAARSPYLRKLIEEAIKKPNFKGSIKMQDVNGKPLKVIIHWVYTGELHENAGKVMEEVVDASIKFELTHLLKVLDKKLVTICNKENMFRLYQVAQKNAMPTAMEDISTYIRGNL